MRWFIFIIAFTFVAGSAEALASSGDTRPSRCKAPKKKRKIVVPKDEQEEGSSPKATIEPKDEAGDEEEADEPEDTRSREEIEKERAEQAERKAEAEGRKESLVTPGTASRWSNKGAMTPIESPIPITRKLPDRTLPIAPGAETPGQALVGGEELLQARIFVSAYRLVTSGQNFVYTSTVFDPLGPGRRIEGADADIELLRWRMNVAYERIAGSDFGTHIDVEYRARINGARPTDHRLNELYISYGLTDFRRDQTMSWGLAFGRLAVREAGYAQTDGALLRFKLDKDVTLGIFGGVTGNPYGFNWAQQRTQEFSADWIRGGAFLGYRRPRLSANAAAVMTFTLLGGESLPGARVEGQSGIDRLYIYLDGNYLVTPTFNVYATGWVDVIGGHPFQNVEIVGSYSPVNALDLRFSVGRFSTVIYEGSVAYSYSIDQLGNRAVSTTPGADPLELPIVDENGNPIVPFDAVIGSAIYNSLRGRIGYRIIREAEVFGGVDTLLRDTSYTNALYLEEAGREIEFASLRALPTIGGRFRDANLFDATLQFTYIMDEQSNADAMVQGWVGRGYEGLYAMLDVRRYFGAIAGLDGGLDLSYVLPRDWFPGRFLLRGQVRYFREAIPLGRVQRPDDGPPVGIIPDPAPGAEPEPVPRIDIPTQESFLGFLSAEWRL